MYSKKFMMSLTATVMAMSLTAAPVVQVMAKAAPDGHTEAKETSYAGDGAYDKWKEEWNSSVKNDWTQISLTPGADASKLNFAWYSLEAEGVPKLKIGEGRNMKNAKYYTAEQQEATTSKDGVEYKSNKVTADGLKENTTYYYSYQVNGVYTKPAKYQTKDSDKFSFIFVGDPQIGSSNELKGEDKEEFYQAQSDSVCNDSFNWGVTLKSAMDKTDDKAAFVVSAGDQIQTTKKKSPNKAAWVSEVEYSGYLSPDVLANLPVATTVGNHDADNANYKYHFNTPNSSELGDNGTVGGDYWFRYGDVLFMVLNTQDTKNEEHQKFMEETVAANKDCKWKVVTMHQDIYGAAEHSNEPEITNLRYTLVPYFEKCGVDVVLSGHDHAYSRSRILKGAKKTFEYTDDEFDKQLEKDIDADNVTITNPFTVAPGNISSDTTDSEEKKYLDYLDAVMDKDAVQKENVYNEQVINPEGVLYLTANSSSGSKYYDLTARKQSYLASRWQEDIPTYSVIDVTDDTFTINTYRTDSNEKIDSTYTMKKVDVPSEQKEIDKAAVKNVSLKSTSKGKVSVSFSQSAKKVDGYEIQYSTSKNFTKSTTSSVKTKKESATLKNLKAGKKYYVRVRAYKNVSGITVYGKYSSVKSVKVSSK